MTGQLSLEEARVFRLFEQAALAARPCPTNDDIAERIGRVRSTADRIVAGLADIGLIRIHVSGGIRVVEICSTGRRTAPTARRATVHSHVGLQTERNPVAILNYHTGCSWCGCRVDACGCRDGKAARGEVAA